MTVWQAARILVRSLVLAALMSTSMLVGEARPAEDLSATDSAPTAAPAAVLGASIERPVTDLRSQVLAQIPFDWEERLPGWQIEFLPERQGYRGSTFPKKRLIQIYQRPGLTLDDYIHVTAHELGHAVDVTLLDEGDHRLWNVTRERDADASWWVGSGDEDFSSGAGDWAECFAWWQMPRGRFYSELGTPPNADQLATLELIVGT